MLYLIVFLGAGIGGALRHGVNVGSARLFGFGFPYGTLIVNVVGSFLMGLLAGYFAFRPGIAQHARLFLTTGILGGFTTFSTFAYENMNLLRTGDYLYFGLYAAGSVILGIAIVYVGIFTIKYL